MTSHSFAEVGTLSEFMVMRGNGMITADWTDEHFIPALIDMIVDWIDEVQWM